MPSDYYQTLDLSSDASPEQVRKAYRRKALELHPDRNGGDRDAEEGFKAVTEAYAVLSDPGKRAAYDLRRSRDSAGPTGSGGGTFRQEELFAELFRDPQARHLFEQMAREFETQGLRFDEAYVRRMFGGTRGPFVVGGFFFAGPLGALLSGLFGTWPSAPRSTGKHPPKSQLPREPSTGVLGKLLGGLLPGSQKQRSTTQGASDLDVHFSLPVTHDVLQRGGEVQVRLDQGGQPRAYKVRVPAGSTPGRRLRLSGKGNARGTARGDLYLELRGPD